MIRVISTRTMRRSHDWEMADGIGVSGMRLFCVSVRGQGRAHSHCGAFYITGGTVMPMTANVRISSRRTTATVASRNCFRFSSGSFRMG
jgi:hypothetical protein